VGVGGRAVCSSKRVEDLGRLMAEGMMKADGLDDALLLREWFAVAWSREVVAGKPVARRVLGQDVVLWRSGGEVQCWRDLCVHRGAKLSLGVVKGECLVCPYHAWEYDRTGQCVLIPAQPNVPPPLKARAETYVARERYGMVWVCLGEPAGDVPAFAMGEAEGFRTVLAGPYAFKAKGPRVIENLFDVAHLGYVHAGLLGDPGRMEIEEYEVETAATGPVAKDIRIWQPDPDGTGRAALVSYKYWAAGPLTAGIEKVAGEQRFGILAQVVPVDEETVEVRMAIAMNYGLEIPETEIVAFQDRVTEQDRVVVESQRPEMLPLDLQAELHLRSDRMAIAYRRWLREIGLGYGTA
jgi:phenylpropionate dioxygenase-like ring-hydroxylating dioxygenase large terminal subunit